MAQHREIFRVLIEYYYEVGSNLDINIILYNMAI
jgi:hypothetical protein